MTSVAEQYVGTELELFSAATRWKAYFARSLAPFVRGDVLEVGAGIGSNIRGLHGPGVRSWHGLEPDPALAARARQVISGLPGARITVGTTETPGLGDYDSILYIDVLEHIEDDRGELGRAATLLRPGGHLVVLCPAHQALYSEFDRTIGHFRRYDAKSLEACGPSGCELERSYYLDCVGMLASFANRWFLKREQPSPAQIATWDRLMVPLSTVLDPCFGRRLGKSVVAIWRRPL
jgi:SAM-dependent methyltransferase